MPPPFSMHGIEQGQSIDGQVAVNVVLGVHDQGHADEDRPEQAQAQHHPGPARTAISGGGGLMGHGEKVRSSARPQTKKSDTGQRNPGSSGRFSRMASSARVSGISSPGR